MYNRVYCALFASMNYYLIHNLASGQSVQPNNSQCNQPLKIKRSPLVFFWICLRPLTLLIIKLFSQKLDWFRSYLTDGKQYLCYNSSNSSHQPITCGVPQEFVLGPLLFILYTEDIDTTSNVILFCLFADDTSLLISHKTCKMQ